MKEIIQSKIKQSKFRTWLAFSLSLGYSKKNRAGLKQRIERNINFLNETLKHIGLEVCFKEVESET